MLLWNRIVATSSPGMASDNSSGCEIKPLYGTMLFNGLQRVGRASGGEAAGGRFKRRYAVLIELNQDQKRKGRYPQGYFF